MIRSYGFPEQVLVLSLFRKDSELKSHDRYVAAKGGDPVAALDLIVDLALPWLLEQQVRFAQSLKVRYSVSSATYWWTT